MSYETTRATIETRLGDNWSTTDIEWPDVHYDPCDGQAYIRLAINFGDSEQISMGTAVRQYRHVGLLIISIFTPEDGGSKTRIGYADSISSIWRGQTLTGGIIFRSPGVTTLGKVGGWVQTNVTVPFQWDEYI